MERKREGGKFVLVVWFTDILTLVGYLMKIMFSLSLSLSLSLTHTRTRARTSIYIYIYITSQKYLSTLKNF